MNTNTTKSTPAKGKFKTLIFTASTKGGILKTSDTLDLIDHARYTPAKIKVYDGDNDNKASIRRYYKAAIPVLITDVDQLNALLANVAAQDDDVTILDLPGAVTSVIGPFLQEAIDWLPQLGLRLHILLHITSDKDTVSGAAAWTATLKRMPGYTVFVSPRDGDFTPGQLPGGAELVKLAQNRVITIPRIAQDLIKLYREKRLLKTDLCQPESGLQIFQRLRWIAYTRRIWQQISPHFDAITGFAPPSMPDWLTEQKQGSPEEIDPVLKRLAAEEE